MKLDRLLEITILLMNRGTITAPELANRFGVSTRTIYRDIDALSSAGVPVYMVRGVGGGISLMEGFTLPKTIISKEERDSILFSLQALQTTRYPEIDLMLEKLSGLFRSASTQWIHIDFSPWGTEPQKEHKIQDLREAILSGQVLEIDYVNTNNRRSRRRIEPVQLVYKAHSWYLRAWCRQREAMRTFRLSRIRRLSFTGECFDKSRVYPESHGDSYGMGKPMIHLVLRCAERQAYRLYDDYDERWVTDNGDGTYTLEIDFPEDEWVYGFVLSFGGDAEVIAPPELREEIRERIAVMQQVYQ